MRNQECKETSDSTNIVGEGFESDSDILSVIADENFFDSWILDSSCSFHMCPYKECFDTYKAYDGCTVLMDNDSSSKVVRIGTVKVKMFDGVVRKLTDVRHVPTLRRSLISLGALDTRGGVVKVESSHKRHSVSVKECDKVEKTPISVKSCLKKENINERLKNVKTSAQVKFNKSMNWFEL
ncbi:uncharacterized protein LOC133034417 [Cannabis sativa]|uniref:uncharacterized protein LOC133034417 n=1 Tax=Cannabis sativa TaxID=3483 RepID=UPI0029CA3A54|nr:uncharacterized protein LOC133034417 [Cannabis sativa]